MIIAIDEVGDFAPYSKRYNFMIAALLSQSGDHLQRKHEQFDKWKVSLDGGKFTKQGEVKGTDLTDDELLRFVNDVIIADPAVRNVQIRIIPSENSEHLVDQFRKVETDAIRLMGDHYQSIQDEDGAMFFKKFQNWFKYRNFQHYLKMMMLENCIGRSVQLAIGTSLVYWLAGDDSNLTSLEIKMDYDFIRKKGEKKFFKELLRQAFRRITERHPIPMVAELATSGHQFSKFLLPDNRINLRELFEDKCDFYDSHHHFELQIADILGAIFHRDQNKDSCHDCVTAIDGALGKQGQIKVHIKMDNAVADLTASIKFDEK